MILADKIVRLRKKNGWSQEELAEKMTAFKRSFGRKKKPEIITISAAGRLEIDTLISAIEKKFLGLIENEIQK